MKESKLVTIIITILILFTYGAISGGCTKKRSNIGTDTAISSLSDIYTILIYGTVHLLGNCTKDVTASLVEYWLYTQTNSAGELLKSPEHVDSNKTIKFLLHGWKNSKNSDFIVAIKDAYLKRYDANIIVVDYGSYANGSYQSAYCNAPYVAQNIANFICQLEAKSIHILGHSLGGQVAGMAGKNIQDKCNKTVGRITGLDPAGPLYEGVSPNARLDKSDATFVDVVHTNQGQFGYIGELGHVDFYPNGGMIQPGCLSVFTNYTVLSKLTLDSIVELPLNFVTCNHQRSCFLFAESILVNSFYSTSVSSCLGLCVPDIGTASHCYMGESLHSAPSGTKKQFTCSTNDKPKYGKGPDGPLV